jgi:hypothetical protein
MRRNCRLRWLGFRVSTRNNMQHSLRRFMKMSPRHSRMKTREDKLSIRKTLRKTNLDFVSFSISYIYS